MSHPASRVFCHGVGKENQVAKRQQFLLDRGEQKREMDSSAGRIIIRSVTREPLEPDDMSTPKTRTIYRGYQYKIISSAVKPSYGIVCVGRQSKGRVYFLNVFLPASILHQRYLNTLPCLQVLSSFLSTDYTCVHI
jgi:hypothetical protein